jgi:hypothetical protein
MYQEREIKVCDANLNPVVRAYWEARGYTWLHDVPAYAVPELPEIVKYFLETVPIYGVRVSRSVRNWIKLTDKFGRSGRRC